MSSLNELFKIIEIQPEKESIFIEAMTHRSYSHETKEISHNERLEFLGDAVLELVTTEYLFNKFPEEPEGTLTSIRAAMVNTTNLGKVAKNNDFSKYMFLGRGEEMSGGREKEHLLANLVESLIGAIYVDQGITKAKEFIEKFVFPSLEDILENRLHKDPKSELQEIVQEELQITPHYKPISEEGPDHEKVFTMGVYFDDKLISVGTGNSKKEGEESAARVALKGKAWENN